jgi:hypothetical protein
MSERTAHHDAVFAFARMNPPEASTKYDRLHRLSRSIDHCCARLRRNAHPRKVVVTPNRALFSFCVTLLLASCGKLFVD